MARVTARNTSFYATILGASRQFGGRANSATLSFTSEAVDVTTFGEEFRSRVSDGIKDWELTISGMWDGAASQIDEWLYNAHSACIALQYGPGGSATNAVKYSGCGILQDYEISGEYDGAVEFSCTWVAAGSLTRGCW